MSKIIGYARVSTEDQNLSLQTDDLEGAGCQEIFTDKVSGSKSDRPGLKQCLASLEEGDTLVVWKIDRLGRSLSHLVQVVNDLKERGIGFRSIKDGFIDTTTAGGELIFHIFGAFAQFERSIIQERTQAGLKAARARGKMGGRKPVAAEDPKVKTAKKMHLDHSLRIGEICSTLKISRATFYRYVNM